MVNRRAKRKMQIGLYNVSERARCSRLAPKIVTCRIVCGAARKSQSRSALLRVFAVAISFKDAERTDASSVPVSRSSSPTSAQNANRNFVRPSHYTQKGRESVGRFVSFERRKNVAVQCCDVCTYVYVLSKNLHTAYTYGKVTELTRDN